MSNNRQISEFDFDNARINAVAIEQQQQYQSHMAYIHYVMACIKYRLCQADCGEVLVQDYSLLHTHINHLEQSLIDEYQHNPKAIRDFVGKLVIFCNEQFSSEKTSLEKTKSMNKFFRDDLDRTPLSHTFKHNAKIDFAILFAFSLQIALVATIIFLPVMAIPAAATILGLTMLMASLDSHAIKVPDYKDSTRQSARAINSIFSKPAMSKALTAPEPESLPTESLPSSEPGSPLCDKRSAAGTDLTECAEGLTVDTYHNAITMKHGG
jgi:hypothetical protein